MLKPFANDSTCYDKLFYLETCCFEVCLNLLLTVDIIFYYIKIAKMDVES